MPQIRQSTTQSRAVSSLSAQPRPYFLQRLLVAHVSKKQSLKWYFSIYITTLLKKYFHRRRASECFHLKVCSSMHQGIKGND